MGILNLTAKASLGLIALFLVFSAPLMAEDEGGTKPTKMQDNAIHQVLDEFIRSLRANGVARAYYGYTSPAFRDTTTFVQFTAFVEHYPSLGRNRTITYAKIIYDANIASVSANASSLERLDNRIEFALTYEDAKWRINGIKVFPAEPPK